MVVKNASALESTIDRNERCLRKEIFAYNSLVGRIDNIIADPRYVPVGRDLPPPEKYSGEDPIDYKIRWTTQRLVYYAIGQDVGSPIMGSARDIRAQFLTIHPWPKEAATLLSDVNALQTVLKLHTELLSNAKASKLKSVDPSQCVGGNLTQFNACSQATADLLPIVKKLQVGEAEEKAYTVAYTNLSDYVNQRLDTLTAARFVFRGEEVCKGLNSSRRDMTFTLTLDASKTISIDVVCQSKLLVSAGIGLSTLPQLSYGTVPINPYGSLKPPSSVPTPLASGAGTIQALGISDIRPIPVTMLNYSVLNLGGERELFTSFGLGVGSSQSSTYVDYVGGLSIGFTRSALLTLGAHLGAETALQPGYSTSQFIVGAPPTTTRYRPAFVLVVSYGGGS